jgi:hypothetical protein
MPLATAVSGSLDTAHRVEVHPVVLDEMACAAGTQNVLDPDHEPANAAVADGGIQPAGRMDADRHGIDAGLQPADLPIVAVDGDVVGVDGDGSTAADVCLEVLLETIDALRSDHGWQAGDVGALIDLGSRRGEHAGTEQQGQYR